jgi:translation initiation factor IF-2
MNNAKVRIYELSKELELDNKDILTICERLNISVKSHSSTITEDEASRIRAAAAKHSGGGNGGGNGNASNHATGSHSSKTPPPILNQAGSSKGSKRPVQKPQQILEIRRHQPAPLTPPKPPEPPKAAGNVESEAAVTETADFVDESAPAGSEKQRPVQPNRPVSKSSVAPSAVASGNGAPAPVAKRNSESPDHSGEVRPERAERGDRERSSERSNRHEGRNENSGDRSVRTDKSASALSQESVAPPVRQRLVEPPSRPQPPKPKTPGSSSEGPILKRDRDGERPSRPNRDGGRDGAKDGSRDGVSTGDRPQRVIPSAPKPPLELRRPKAAPTESGDIDTDDDGATPAGDSGSALGLERKPELRRPSPPRGGIPGKRKGKDEPDAEEEAKQKSMLKAAAKNKRRTQSLDDEDVDLDDLNDDRSEDGASAPLSLSLMRPPKPKSKQTPAKPTTTVKGRTISRPQSRSQRRDRKNEETVIEKPEFVILTHGLTVHELAQEIVVPETEIIKLLFFKGIATNINQTLDIPTAKMVAEEFGIEVETAEVESEAKKVTEMIDEADRDSLQPRPPVVTIMGHVDHGKTTLLDSIRKSKVAQGEAGGITQHIGAYHVDVEHNDEMRQVVFLDTPGHEAFTAMRARGARVTDIAVLVVAADDGVRPQTIEAISHAKAAQVPIVVAINKIDKEAANPDRVKQELMEHALVPEEWGGDTIMVPVSAISGENLDTLLEMLLLVAEVEDLHANPDRNARGTVIEAHLDKARGPVATLLIQNGSLHVGDCLVVGPVFGKVRAMIDDRGQRVNTGSPSFAVEVLGLSDVPQAGEEFEVYPDEKEARALADTRASEQRQSRLQQAMASRRVTLNSLSAQAQEGDLKELNLVLKGDVQGSIEAILAALQQLPQDEVQIRVLMAAPGEITETDVDLAAASSAVIVGFNTTLAPGARQSADRMGVDIRDYDIIYKLLEDIEGAMEGLLEPEMVEESLGEVEVRAVFPLRRGTVAGCYVLSGKVTRNCRIRVMRNSAQVYEGNLDSLKRMKEDAKEVASGFECGIACDHFNDWQESDRIHAFRLISKRRTLSGSTTR